jgi:O-antigen ligase
VLWVASFALVRRHRGRILVLLVPVLPLLALMALSTAWSVKPLTTFGRAGGLAIVLMIGASLAVAMQEELLARADVVDAFLAGMTAVALGGALLLAVSQTDAMHPGTGRLNGLGGDPNTVSSMIALGVPLALGVALRAQGRRRWLAGGVLVVLVGTIVASGSRGSLLAAAVGSIAVATLAVRGMRARATAVALVALVIAAAAVGTAKPIGTRGNAFPVPTGSIGQKLTGPKGHRVYVNAELTRRLEDDIGAAVPGGPPVDPHRSFLNSSGRTQAWEGAVRQADQRPLAGYGFGTEPSVFVDRYVAFQGAYVENAYIGLYLQLGAAGLLLLGLALAVVARRVWRGLADPGTDAAAVGFGVAFTGAVVAGLVLATSQSFPWSAGNVTVLTFWTALIAAPAVLTRAPSASR